MTDLHFEILDLIYNHEEVLKIKESDCEKWADLDIIPKKELLAKLNYEAKQKCDELLSELLKYRYINKRNMLQSEGYEITTEGLKAYISKINKKEIQSKAEFSKSQIETNKSVKSTNKIQKGSIFVTGIIIFFGLISQISQCNISEKSQEQSKLQMSINQQTQKTDSLFQVYLEARIDSIQIAIDDLYKIRKKK
jgi:hypothetical protein